MICRISFSAFSDAVPGFIYARAKWRIWSICEGVNILICVAKSKECPSPCAYFPIWNILLSKSWRTFFFVFSKVSRVFSFFSGFSSIIWLWLGGIIASSKRYSYLSILSDNNASLLISYCMFLSLILSSIEMISFYIFSKTLFLKHSVLSDVRVATITKKIWLCSTFFVKIHKNFKVNIRWMIKCHFFLNIYFPCDFHNENCVQFSLTSVGTGKYDCVIKAVEMFSFLL